ncbi:MAG: flavin reductase family protein [Actinomycetia bacterium]|nr:flavin reductase family protein [Actinomycetes bacterium]
MTPTRLTAAPRPITSVGHRTIDPSILYLGTPVVLISTRNAGGTTNLAPISSAWWMGKTGVIGMGTRSHTVENLRRERECVLSVPSVDLVTEVNRLALTTGSDPMPGYKDVMGFEHVRDKFARAGLTEIASEVVSPPRVMECPIQLEGTVSSIMEVGDPKDHTAAIEVRIVRTHVHESILAPGHRHHIDPNKWRPLIMNFLEFYGLGSQVHPSRLAEVF